MLGWSCQSLKQEQQLPLLTVQSTLCAALQRTGYFSVTLGSSHWHCILQEKSAFPPDCTFSQYGEALIAKCVLAQNPSSL